MGFFNPNIIILLNLYKSPSNRRFQNTEIWPSPTISCYFNSGLGNSDSDSSLMIKTITHCGCLMKYCVIAECHIKLINNIIAVFDAENVCHLSASKINGCVIWNVWTSLKIRLFFLVEVKQYIMCLKRPSKFIYHSLQESFTLSVCLCVNRTNHFNVNVLRT